MHVFYLKYDRESTPCLIDDEDKYLIEKNTWRIHPRGVIRYGDNKLLHRHILGIKNFKIGVLHRNGNKHDNRKCNLKIVKGRKDNSKYIPVYNLFGADGKPTGIYRATKMVAGKYYTNWYVRSGSKGHGRAMASFAVKKYGEEGAVKKAIECRLRHIRQRVKLGKATINDVNDTWDSWQDQISNQQFAKEKYDHINRT